VRNRTKHLQRTYAGSAHVRAAQRGLFVLTASADALTGERTTEMFAPGLCSVQNNQTIT
jgi:hypothetical protein